MHLIADECSSKHVMEEIKQRIKDRYHSQEKFARTLGASRKTLNRILNHGTDIDTLFRICQLLEIRRISIE